MKIRGWIKKYVPSVKWGPWIAKILEDQYVIRECEFCFFMKKRPTTFLKTLEQFCDNTNADLYGQPAHDGCIHFEEKK